MIRDGFAFSICCILTPRFGQRPLVRWRRSKPVTQRQGGSGVHVKVDTKPCVWSVYYHCASRSEHFVRARPATHCHTPSHPVAPWAVMRQGAGSSRTLHTVLPSSCTYAQSRSSSLSLQLHERVAQSAYVAPTTKCKRRAAVVPKCVVNDGFHSNNNGYRLKSITTNQARDTEQAGSRSM